LFDVLVVDGLAAVGALLDGVLAGAAGGLADAGADVVEASVDVSFFSAGGVGLFSPSDGGFSLFE
jgi:hypothetical protein